MGGATKRERMEGGGGRKRRGAGWKWGGSLNPHALLNCRGYYCIWTQEGVITSEQLRNPGSLATEKNIEQEVSETQSMNFSSAPAWGRACSWHLEPSVES